MRLKLPKVAESLVNASNEKNVNNYLACFTENATIDDVGDLVTGKKAISGWFTGKDYEYQMEPKEVAESKEAITLKVKVTGTFEGSPVDFKLDMKLHSGLIQHLKMGFVE